MVTDQRNPNKRVEVFKNTVRCAGCPDPWETVCRWCLKQFCIGHLPPHVHQCKVMKLKPKPKTELYAWLIQHGYYKYRGKWRYKGTADLWKVKR